MAGTLEKSSNEIIKHGDSINDSGIEMSGEEKEKETKLNLNCPWVLGQLAWARGSSYPFWPCVVTLDPKTMLYYRVQNKGRSQALMIHVQYFGDGGRHNWVLSHYMIAFSGLEDFKNLTKSITPETKKKDPKYAAAFSPKLGVKKQWGTGVTEASGLMHLSNEERASMFEPIAPSPVETADTPNNKLKRKLSVKGSKIPNETPTPGPKRFKKVESKDEAGKSLPNSESIAKLETESVNESISVPKEELSKATPVASRRKSTRAQNQSVKEVVDTPKRQYIRKKAPKLSEEEKNRRDEIDFEDYYNLNKDVWKAEHPEASDEEVRTLLKDMWNEMDAAEKSNNLNRNFDDYRYKSTVDQPEVKRSETKLQKDDSKNKENSQQGNKNISKVNSKTEDKISPESEKVIETPKANGSSQKDKVKAVMKANGSPQKEKRKLTEISDDSQSQKGTSDKNSRTEVVSQNGKNEKCETKSSQDDPKSENLKQNSLKESEEDKICQSCQKKDSPRKTSKDKTENEDKIVEGGEKVDSKMKVEGADNGEFVCTNCRNEKA
ncbi:histone-lysine N-methyltransferase NSD2-like [Belonocnema kinseyi]|uniref:histone-lysine N-methyltransferase NSD2-like n=1 Tax=Belonocnema kinseyi TaxID=2817044 RepID=UPI00143D2A64|nr:histone-lysine N-methyltransferase NSD2-like [Belonocnema kinseyi]